MLIDRSNVMSDSTGKPVVRVHETSGLRYLLGAEQVLFENGKTMTRELFDTLKDADNRIQEHFKLVIGPEYDWPYACSTGHLRRKRASPDLVASPKTERRRRRQAEATAAEQKKEGARKFYFSSVFLVLAVMAAVGFGSAVISAYHTSMFLIQGGKPAWTAVITGTMLILFSGTAFTAARYFLQEKGLQRSFGFLFLVAGFVVIAYSVFSTVTVNFNQFKWVDDEKASVAVEDSELLAAHEKLLARSQGVLDDICAELESLEREAEYWRDRSWRRYDEIRARIVELQEVRREQRDHQIYLETSRPQLVTQAAQSRETVYTFLARFLGLPEDTARFFVYVVPACLYDILAPFALSVVLLLIDRRRKEAENG